MITPRKEEVAFPQGTTYKGTVRVYSSDKKYAKIVSIEEGIPTRITLESDVPDDWTLWFISNEAQGSCSPALGSLDALNAMVSQLGSLGCCEDKIGEHNQIQFRRVLENVIEIDMPSSSVPVSEEDGYIVYLEPEDLIDTTMAMVFYSSAGEEVFSLDMSDIEEIAPSVIEYRIRPEHTEELNKFDRLTGTLTITFPSGDKYALVCLWASFVC